MTWFRPDARLGLGYAVTAVPGPSSAFVYSQEFALFAAHCACAAYMDKEAGTAAPKAAGFNVGYESAEGWKGGFGWYTVPEGEGWTTKTWTFPDPQFVGKWGFHFGFNSDSTQHSAYLLRRVTVSKH